VLHGTDPSVNRNLRNYRTGPTKMNACIRFCFIVILALSVESAVGQTKLLLEDMTWEEIKSAIDAGVDTAIITIGATEQHGPQIALSSDSITGDYLAPEIAQRLGRTLIAPNIRVGVSPHHMYFPGTISVRSEVLVRLVIEYVHSLVWHGFRHIAIIPTHGGNFSTVAEAGRKLSLLYPYVNIMAFADAEGYIGTMKSTSARLGIALDVAGSHAGMSETSMALAARPDLVRMNRSQTGFMGDAYGVGERTGRDGTYSVTPIGVFGDPRYASADAGREYLGDLATFLTDYFQRQRSSWMPAPPQNLPKGGLQAPEGDLAEGIRARRSGDYGAAKAFFRAHIASHPESIPARVELARTLILTGDYTQAAEILNPMRNSNDFREKVPAYDELALIGLYQGQFNEAIKLKASAQRINKENGGSVQDEARRFMQIGYLQTETGQTDAAVEAFENALRLVPGPSPLNLDIQHLTALAEVKQGRLHKAGGRLRAIGDVVFETGLENQIRRFYQLDSELRIADGHASDALISLPGAIEIYDHPLYRETQARSYIALKQWPEAEETLLRIIQLTDARLDIPIVYVRAHYKLGSVYERQGRTQDAARMYNTFLDFWEKSDTQLPEVRRAREALSRLSRTE